MNEDILKGEWKQLKGRIRQRWGRLTDDDLAEIEGDREILIERSRRECPSPVTSSVGWVRARGPRTTARPDGYFFGRTTTTLVAPVRISAAIALLRRSIDASRGSRSDLEAGT